MNNNLSKKQIGNAVIWSFAAEIAAKVLVPITNMILARILAPEAFGVIATINMIVTLADKVSTSGVSKYIVQHNFNDENELKQNANVAFWTNMAISILAWVLIVIFRKELCNIVGNPGYEKALIIAALSLPLTAFSSIQEALFQRSLHYKVLFYRRVAVSLLPFFVTIPLALKGAGYWALIIGTLASNVTKIVMLSFASPWKPSLYYSFHNLKIMYKFCIWMLLGSTIRWVVTYVDVLMVSNTMGAFYTGLYKNSQITVTAIISVITSATTSVLFASLSREQDNEERFENILFDFQKKVGMFVVPLGVGIFCFSDLITYILLGSQWMKASHFIGIFGFSTAMICVFADFCTEACKAKGKPYLHFFAQLTYLIILIPICYYGVSKGFNTLGNVRALSNFILIFIYFVIVKIFINISPLKMLWFEKIPIVASLVMGLAGKLMLKYLPNIYGMQFVYIFICMIIYFVLISISKEYRKELIEILITISNKLKRKS